MIKVEACRGCGRIIYCDTMGGIRIRCDTEPLEAEGATRALIKRAQLYRVTFLDGRPANFSSASAAVLVKLQTEPEERPVVVREHACTAAGAPQTPFPALGDADAPKGRETGAQRLSPVDPSTRSSAASTDPSSAPAAETQDFDGPRCDDCGVIMQEGEYASASLGDVLQFAFHLSSCGV